MRAREDLERDLAGG